MWGAAAAVLIFWPLVALADGGPSLTDSVPPGTVILDVRAEDDCLRASLPGARCLPADVLTGPDGRLANFRDILWLLGTLGLNGSEHAVVTGSASADTEFVAGVLYLAGQARVDILTTPAPALAMDNPGRTRGLSRQVVYTAVMRDHLIVLRDDLPTALASGRMVVQGEGPASSLAAFARQRAVLGVEAAVHIGGPSTTSQATPPRLVHPALIVAGALIAAALLAGAFLRRKRCSF